MCRNHPQTCDEYESMIIANAILIVCLVLSFCFEVAAVINLSVTIRKKSQQLTSVYSGFAALFSFGSIFIWFCFAISVFSFVDMMTWGLWFLVLTALTQFLCYLHSKYYCAMFNKASAFRHMLS